MTEISETNSAPLSAMRLPELKKLASSMGLKGTSTMRKSDLLAAIKAARSAQTSASSTPSAESQTARPDQNSRRRRVTAENDASQSEISPEDLGIELPERSTENAAGEESDGHSRRKTAERLSRRERGERGERHFNRDENNRRKNRRRVQTEAGSPEANSHTAEEHADAKAELMRDLAEQTGGSVNEADDARSTHNDDDDNARRRRGRNKRDRNRNERRDRNQNNQEQDAPDKDEEVLLPVAGILDMSDNNRAYLRTSGYLAGAKDVYVSAQQVKSNKLRPGDAIVGWVRENNNDGEPQNHHNNGRYNRRNNRGHNNRPKFNPLVSIDSINGMTVEQAQSRPEFSKLTPLYPQEQLRLETTPKAVTPRMIDLVAPIGKGQRGLIVSPPKAGKTIVLQQIANAIAVNNPEVHLMVVLVDERPEEVTDMQRTVKGEVIASTFDRPASDHTTVAELAIERAKRLVELGQDVVVLLDSITRLGRAYNLAAPMSGRILSGGVDAAALYPPKKFFGAARNVENGGSLTILATALVETGSKMDEVIFEEFKGTGNMELKLSRQLADKRIFPAVDVAASGTRREELLIDPAQLKIMWRLRRLFAGLEQQQALELVLSKLKGTQSNGEFLMVISKTAPASGDDQSA